MRRVSILLITVALIAGMVGCVPAQHNLTVSSTEGGEVTTPGEEAFTYYEGEVVNLVATPNAGYRFANWTGDVGTIANVEAAETNITMIGHYSITANFAPEIPENLEIRDWYDLNAIRENLGGSYVLMNDLDASTAGYGELASATANQGKGWQPIGTWYLFSGSFDGQGYEIHDLFISRPDECIVGLFGGVGSDGAIEDIGVVNATVTGCVWVDGLVGASSSTVSNSYSPATSLAGSGVGGLVGWNQGTVSNSYFTGRVTGDADAGGLVGLNTGFVSNSYSTGNVTGKYGVVGGLVGRNGGTVSNSYYNYDEVLINGENIITIGALFNEDFEQWLANDKSLDINERLSQEDGYYLISNVSDFKKLLAFGQDDSLKFRLTNDLDLETEANLYIPYLAGEFDGNGHKIRNSSVDSGFISQLGLFGYLASGGTVSEVGAENVNITGFWGIGGLVGWNEGTVSNSYATGSVTGQSNVGGLVGRNEGTVSNSYATGSVTGNYWVGGLVGANADGTVSSSFWDTETSAQSTSAGGTGKTTTEMKTIATFSGAGWNIVAVANPNSRNSSYIWNIVDGQTYPFLNWQPVS